MENETNVAVDTAKKSAVQEESSPAAGTDTVKESVGKTYDEAYISNLRAQMQAESDANVKLAVEEAIKKERMSAEEKVKYETEQREAAIAKREQEINLRELKADTKGMLSKANLPQTFADFVIGADAESTQKNVDALSAAFSKAVQEQVEQRLKGRTPSTGSGSGSHDSDEIDDIINRTLGL